jgi:5'-nucleotidase
MEPPPAATAAEGGWTRRVFCNRTLNLRAIRAIGFDMDYTLIHYRVQEWEQRAYSQAQRTLLARDWPVQQLQFDPHFVCLGLVLDLERGNIVKANRFGYVVRAYHGTRQLEFEEQRAAYARVLVDLEEPRWVFLNTLFSLSTATLYGQLVDLLDAGRLGPGIGYANLYRIINSAVDHVHTEGALKQDIASAPERYVQLDSELPLTLLDLRAAGKQLMLITNSEWSNTEAMMSYAFDKLLPSRMSWRDLFDLIIVSARKPSFFSEESPIFEVASPDGLLRPYSGQFQRGGAYLGGSATFVERNLRLDGEQILYIGDHIAADVRASKDLLRWRTGLVVRELEQELEAARSFSAQQAELSRLMSEKVALERRHAQARLALQRLREGYGPRPNEPEGKLKAMLQALRTRLLRLDEQIAPLAKAAGQVHKCRWGPLMRAGNEASHLARQIERSADVYTSRVSNLLLATPFAYFRAPRGTLPHDLE